MKKISSLITFLCLIFNACNSQIIVKSSETEGQSLLWEISGNGLENPSYLFGTLHLIPKDAFFLPTGTETALASSEALVLEIDIDISLKEQISIVPKMLIPDNKTLADYLSEEEYENLKQYMIDSLGISENKTEKYAHFRPFYLTGILLTEALGKTETYEKYFASEAKQQDKDFIALESIYFQLNLIDSISIEEQVDSYKTTDIKKEYTTLLNCYTNQDLDCMQELIDQEDDADFEKVFLVQRNNNWIEKLTKEILPVKRSFIAVGAAHLCGENGLISLLRNEGYTLRPITK